MITNAKIENIINNVLKSSSSLYQFTDCNTRYAHMSFIDAVNAIKQVCFACVRSAYEESMRIVAVEVESGYIEYTEEYGGPAISDYPNEEVAVRCIVERTIESALYTPVYPTPPELEGFELPF